MQSFSHWVHVSPVWPQVRQCLKLHYYGHERLPVCSHSEITESKRCHQAWFAYDKCGLFIPSHLYKLGNGFHMIFFFFFFLSQELRWGRPACSFCDRPSYLFGVEAWYLSFSITDNFSCWLWCSSNGIRFAESSKSSLLSSVLLLCTFVSSASFGLLTRVNSTFLPRLSCLYIIRKALGEDLYW